MGKGERVSVCVREKDSDTVPKRKCIRLQRIKRESDRRRGTEFTF